MLTNCPECKGELSTAATTCPHCGVPVNHGQVAGGPAAPGQPGVAQPPKSHFLRNCLVCGCLLVVLVVGAMIAAPVYIFSQLKRAMITKADAPALAAKIAPGLTAPAGYELEGGLNFAMFGLKAQAVIVAPVGTELGKKDAPPPKSLFGAGAFSGKGQSKEQIHEQVEKFLDQLTQKSNGGTGGGSSSTVSSVEEDLPIGPGTDTVKAVHQVTQDANGKKSTDYLVVLDNYENEFGYLVIFGMGPEDSFDADAFKAMLKTVKPPTTK